MVYFSSLCQVVNYRQHAGWTCLLIPQLIGLVHALAIAMMYCCKMYSCTDVYVHSFTSEMIHHHGASLSKQQSADVLLCHGTQQDLSPLAV